MELLLKTELKIAIQMGRLENYHQSIGLEFEIDNKKCNDASSEKLLKMYTTWAIQLIREGYTSDERILNFCNSKINTHKQNKKGS